MSAPRALLTGYGGFTGRYVAAELMAAGYAVSGLVMHGCGDEDGAVSVINADLLDRGGLIDAVRRAAPEVVIHLASVSFVAHDDVEAIYRTNLIGTRNLLEALWRSNSCPELVILASSANVYGNAGIECISESAPMLPANDYAVSKMAMEHVARLWQGRLPIVVTRPFNYTGVGQSTSFLIPKIVDHYRHRRPSIQLGNTDVIRDFGDVRDVAATYLRLVETKPIGETFNICTGVGHSLSDVIDIVGDLAGYRIEVEVDQRFVRENEVKRLIGDSSRLNRVLGAHPRRDLRDTLAWMYAAE